MSKMLSKKDLVKRLAESHTNLSIWGAVITLLEGGLLCGASDYKAVQQVIKIARCQQGKHLRAHDDVREAILNG